jgi:hypothetical protein
VCSAKEREKNVNWVVHWLTCVAFLPDGRRAITASYDKLLKLWKLRK